MAATEGRFRRDHRIRKPVVFRQVLAEGRRVTTTHSVLVFCRRATQNGDYRGARLGLVVSRKVGGAVQRNRVKRLIREAFRGTIASWPEEMDLVVIARPHPVALSLGSLLEEWESVGTQIQRAYRRAWPARVSGPPASTSQPSQSRG